MNLEKRIGKLEKYLSIKQVDPGLEAELTKWLKSHPKYLPFAQPESNKAIVMPEHLSQAFMLRMERFFAERNLLPNLTNLIEIWEDLF